MEDFKKSGNNNFDCMFDGRSPNHLNSPAFVRLVCQDPKFVAEISSAVTHFRDFRHIRTPEAAVLADIKEYTSGEKYYTFSERLNKKIIELLENLPWDKLFEAYNRLIQLVDQKDISDDYGGPLIPVKKYIQRVMKERKEYLQDSDYFESGTPTPEEIKDLFKNISASNMFFR